jgi:hypothetical protein
MAQEYKSLDEELAYMIREYGISYTIGVLNEALDNYASDMSDMGLSDKAKVAVEASELIQEVRAKVRTKE